MRERRGRKLLRPALVDSVAVDEQLGRRVGAHREDVARCAHRIGRALDDAMQHRVDVVRGHEVAGGRVGAVQALGHRHELCLQRGHALLGIRCGGGELRVPRDGVHALRSAACLTFALLDTGERESEQDGQTG